MKAFLASLSRMALLGVVALTLLPLLWRFAPRLTAFEAMAPQLALGGVLLVAVNLWFRSRFVVLVGIAAVVWNAILIWPALPFWSGPAAVSANGPPLKVLSLNLWYANDDSEGTRAYLAQSGADVIGLVELTPELKAAMAPLAETYPYQVARVSREAPVCEIMLLSKHPLREAHAGLVDERYPCIAEAVIDWNGHPLGIAVTHWAWPFLEPVDAAPAATGNQAVAAAPQFPDVPRLSQSFQAANLAVHAGKMPDDLILIGDFNGPSWSAAQTAFRAATGLENRGHLLPTWPTWAWPILRLPLDHVFVRGKARVTEIGLGPEVGSDHLPVAAEIAVLQ